jgi:hypothetical protein
MSSTSTRLIKYRHSVLFSILQLLSYRNNSSIPYDNSKVGNNEKLPCSY